MKLSELANPAVSPAVPQPEPARTEGLVTDIRVREASAEPPSATAVTLAGTPSAIEVSSAIEQARVAYDLGDLEVAINFAETALVAADELASRDASEVVERAAPLLDGIFLARLGMPTSRLSALTASGSAEGQVTPEQAFLLSRVEGGVTLEEVLDLSPLPRRRTLRLLVGMLRQRMIAVE